MAKFRVLILGGLCLPPSMDQARVQSTCCYRYRPNSRSGGFRVSGRISEYTFGTSYRRSIAILRLNIRTRSRIWGCYESDPALVNAIRGMKKEGEPR